MSARIVVEGAFNVDPREHCLHLEQSLYEYLNTGLRLCGPPALGQRHTDPPRPLVLLCSGRERPHGPGAPQLIRLHSNVPPADARISHYQWSLSGSAHAYVAVSLPRCCKAQVEYPMPAAAYGGGPSVPPRCIASCNKGDNPAYHFGLSQEGRMTLIRHDDDFKLAAPFQHLIQGGPGQHI
jgi:hypothetical protein